MTWISGREYRSYSGTQYQPISSDLMEDPRGRRYTGMWHQDARKGFGTEVDSENNLKEGFFVRGEL